ncbi:MAG: DNA-formamidopyrimidine glycosylase [Candidatus Margulisiibacteriota bacterium]
MPELPEVETIVQGLSKTIIGLKIDQVDICYPKIINFPNIKHTTNAKKCCALNDMLQGDSFSFITRHGKYIKLTTAKGSRFIVHLRMTGQLLYMPKSYITDKHVHLRIVFYNGWQLVYRDTRQFGRWIIVPEDKQFEDYINAGPDALSVSKKELAVMTARYQKRKLKAFLLDQTILAGVGNIYADEICFLLGLDPEVPVGKVDPAALHTAIIKVLKLGIKHRGTSIVDYITTDGTPGNFQNLLNVYMRKQCAKCGTEIIRKKVAGRTSHVCPQCQVL